MRMLLKGSVCHLTINDTRLILRKKLNGVTTILGNPGAVSWVVRKSKRPSLQERKKSPWDSTLNRPVPKPIKILVCDWAQKYFCAQSESSSFRVTFVTSYSKEFTVKLFDRLFAILVRFLQESFPRSSTATERRTMKPKKSPNLGCL